MKRLELMTENEKNLKEELQVFRQVADNLRRELAKHKVLLSKEQDQTRQATKLTGVYKARVEELTDGMMNGAVRSSAENRHYHKKLTVLIFIAIMAGVVGFTTGYLIK